MKVSFTNLTVPLLYIAEPLHALLLLKSDSVMFTLFESTNIAPPNPSLDLDGSLPVLLYSRLVTAVLFSKFECSTTVSSAATYIAPPFVILLFPVVSCFLKEYVALFNVKFEYFI